MATKVSYTSNGTAHHSSSSPPSSSLCKSQSQPWLSLGNLQHAGCFGLFAAFLWAQLHLVGVFSPSSSADFPSPAPHDEASSSPRTDTPAAAWWPVLTYAFYASRYLICTPFIFCVFNCLGIFLFSLFPPKPRLVRSPLLGPFLCFRVVTRGMYPDLVRQNVERNLDVCRKVDLQNFLFDVVTDAPIQLPKTSRVREVVVPADYSTPRGSLFKARALQYSLEPEVDILSDDDWIVHLDEETQLTEDSLVGIINFVAEGRHDFGQGVIFYSKGRIVNWVTTLADSVRVGIDYGALRFSFKVLHKPFFSWKGSFIVANAAAEKSVSFDHGPEGSIAEDCFFAMEAFQQGYSFGFVEGEMLEQSTFTLTDYVQQRRRWMRGIYLVAKSSQLALRYRLGPVLMTVPAVCMPLTVVNLLLGFVHSVPLPPHLGVACAFVTSAFAMLVMVGTIKSFSARRYGVLGCALLVVGSLLCSFCILFLELTSSVLAFWGLSSAFDFYIVKKEVAHSKHLSSASVNGVGSVV